MDFVFLSTQGWDEMGGAGRPTHYLARELLARGQRVLFIEVVASRDPAPRPNFTLLNFTALGYGERALRRAWFGLDPQTDVTDALTRALDAFSPRAAERVVLYADPFVPFVEWFPLFRGRGYRIVYHALDDFEALPEIGLYFANRGAEEYLVAHADLVTAVSTTLIEKLSGGAHRAPLQLLRQGFDPRTFPRNPHSSSARPASAPPTLGFWGHVNAFNLDVELIEYVSRARPQWTLQLIGPIDQDPQLPPVAARLRALSNVQLVGPVAHDQLPRYLEAFDVALVPFPDTAFNRARDPLKVFEYLSGYKPIVSAHTPQLAGMPYVLLANSPQAFLDALEHALALSVNRAEVDAYLLACTWSARLDQLLNWLQDTSPEPNAPPLNIDRWYADAANGANLREYMSRTEQLLDERTSYANALEQDAKSKQAHINALQSNNLFWKIKERITSLL